MTQDGGSHSSMALLPTSQGCSSLQGPAWHLAAQPGRRGTRRVEGWVLWVSRDEPSHHGEQKEKLLGAPKGPSVVPEGETTSFGSQHWAVSRCCGSQSAETARSHQNSICSHRSSETAGLGPRGPNLTHILLKRGRDGSCLQAWQSSAVRARWGTFSEDKARSL